MTYAAQYEVKAPFPPGDPRWRELSFLQMGPPDDRVWRRMDRFGRRLRRAGTYRSPLAFAIVYMSRTLKPVQPLTPEGEPVPGTVPTVSFSDFHFAMCEEAKTWMEPRRRRRGVIAPREAAKSTWAYKILPLWAAAHGHRRHFRGFAHSNKMAVERLDDLRSQLQYNELLKFDFPELEIYKGARNNEHLVETGCTLSERQLQLMDIDPRVALSGNRVFATSGIDSVSLGANREDNRPDLICIDDGEPDEGNYAKKGSKGSKEARLKTIRDVVLRMNPAAAVLLSGTVVMVDSIGDDLVKAALGEPTADWVAQEQFTAMYFNAIQDEGTATARSLWPEKWSLEWLLHEQKTNYIQYAVHYANRPPTLEGRYWQQKDFRYNPHFPCDHFIMYVDPAVVAKEGRDHTAVVVVGVDGGRHRAVVKYYFYGHIGPRELGDRIMEYKNNHPEIPLLDVYIEKNNGGDLWLEHVKPRTSLGVRVGLVHTGREVAATGERGKLARIVGAYAYYQNGMVWHDKPFNDLEALLTAFPRTNRDDLADALAGALRKAFEK